MRTLFITFSLLFFSVSINTAAASFSVKDIEKAINDSSRLQEHRQRDESRKPKAILSLATIAKGQKVAELAAGSGYYVALLSRIVGDEGKVYAVDPTRIFEHFPNARETYQKFIKDDPLKNTIYSIQKFDSLKLPEPVDRILMVLYYHDTIWTGEDRTKMNSAIYHALKPGGQFLIVDHHALPGSGVEVTKKLHRMEASIVIPEVTASGFHLVDESKIFATQEDPKNNSVFDELMRGKTDRFVYLFERPKVNK